MDPIVNSRIKSMDARIAVLQIEYEDKEAEFESKTIEHDSSTRSCYGGWFFNACFDFIYYLRHMKNH